MKLRVSFASIVFLLGYLLSSASAQTIQNIAGNGPANNSPAKSAAIPPGQIDLDTNGNVFVAGDETVDRIDPGGRLTRIAGQNGIQGNTGDGGKAVNALLRPSSVAVDPQGNVYIIDSTTAASDLIRVVNMQTSTIKVQGITIAPGNIATVAGNLNNRDTGDATKAITSKVHPVGMAIDEAGNLYFAQPIDHRVRRVDSNGIIHTVAGSKSMQAPGDGMDATTRRLSLPQSVALDNDGNLYIADSERSGVLAVNMQSSTITLMGVSIAPGHMEVIVPDFASNGVHLTNLQQLAVDAAGNIFLAGSVRNLVWKVTSPSGNVSTYAGTGTAGFGGDGGAATSAQLNDPIGVDVDSSGDVYIGDSRNFRIRKVNTSGAINTFAGNGTAQYSGDGGPAIYAQFSRLFDEVVDAKGNVYLADFSNHRVRAINTQSAAITVFGVTIAPGNIATVAGNGTAGFSGDAGTATNAKLNFPSGLALDTNGNLYIADQDNFRVRKVTRAGTISTVAGNGTYGTSGDGGPATSAQLPFPYDVAVDRAGNLYISDTDDFKVRAVNMQANTTTLLGVPIAPGNIDTVAGNGTPGYSGDGGPATSAQMLNPENLLVDKSGNLFIADTQNNVIRKVDTSGIITTFAGDGQPYGYGGDGGPATSAKFFFPDVMAFDGAGNLFIDDSSNNRIRAVNTHTTAVTLFGVTIGPGDINTVVKLAGAIKLDGPGNLYVANTHVYRVK